MAVRESISFFARYFSVWEHLSPMEQTALLDNTNLLQYPKGYRIRGGENECVGVMLIKSGVLRTYMLSEDGKEVTLYRLEKGDICVLSASCILSAITFDVYVDAEEDSEVFLISLPFFTALSKQNIYVECFSYKQTAERFSDVMWAMQQILFMNMDKRLAIFLWDELSKADGDTLHLTHEQIAKYIGSVREVVTRKLSDFASQGIVELFRGGVRILNREKLRSLTL